MRRRWVCELALVASLASIDFYAIDARADEVDAARQAYDRGAAAYDAGEYARAVVELSRADDLAPNEIALDLALKAATKADDAIALVSLADRADRRSVLSSAAQAARAKAAGRTGKITGGCAEPGSCRVSIDGASVRTGEAIVVLVGRHRVVVEDATGRDQRDVEVPSDGTVGFTKRANAVAPPPPPVDPLPPSTESRGISPAWFWAGVGLTAALGGVTAISALDTKKKHDEFASTPSVGLRSDGLDAQLRTNLLAGGTLVTAVGSAVLALVFVDWHDRSSTTRATR